MVRFLCYLGAKEKLVKKHTTDYSKFDALMQQQKEEEDEEEVQRRSREVGHASASPTRLRMTQIGSSSETSARHALKTCYCSAHANGNHAAKGENAHTHTQLTNLLNSLLLSEREPGKPRNC